MLREWPYVRTPEETDHKQEESSQQKPKHARPKSQLQLSYEGNYVVLKQADGGILFWEPEQTNTGSWRKDKLFKFTCREMKI